MAASIVGAAGSAPRSHRSFVEGSNSERSRKRSRSSEPHPIWWHRLLVAVAVAVVAIVVHWPSTHGSYVWDDAGLITKRHDTLDEWSDVPAAFGRAATAGEGVSYYRPIMIASFVVDAKLFGLEPSSFHRTNVALHGVNAALIVLLMSAFGVGVWAAAIAALTFAVHPLQCQAVALILGRNDLLLIPPVVGMIAADEVVRRRGRPRLADALVVLCFAVTLWTKETGIVAPVFLVLLDLLWRGRPLAALRERVPLGIALAVVTALYMLTRVVVIGAMIDTGKYPYIPLPERPAVATAILGYYVRHVVAPWGSAPAPYHPGLVDPHGSALWIAVACVLGYVAATTVALRRSPRLACGLLVFGVALAPVLAIAAPMKVLILDHRTYLPFLGVAFAVTAGARAFASLPGRAAALGVLTILAVLTYRRLPAYADSLSLWKLGIETAPASDYAHNNLGAALMDADRFPEAVEQFREAIRLNPDYDMARYNLAGCLEYLGQSDEALRHFETLVDHRPDDANMTSRVAAIRGRAGDLAGARAMWERALALKPNDPGFLRNLADLLDRSNASTDAVRLRRRLTEIEPQKPQGWAALAASLVRTGQVADAIPAYERTFALGGESGRIRADFARALWQTGRWNDAAFQLRRARELGVVDAELEQRLSESGVELTR